MLIKTLSRYSLTIFNNYPTTADKYKKNMNKELISQHDKGAASAKCVCVKTTGRFYSLLFALFKSDMKDMT